MSAGNKLLSSSFTTIDPHVDSGGEETLLSDNQQTESTNALDPTSKYPMASSSVKCLSKYGNLGSRFIKQFSLAADIGANGSFVTAPFGDLQICT